MFGASNKSPVVDLTGCQDGYLDAAFGTTVNDETKDGCLEELKRINEEIETVRHEVEQEQRRLSQYQTVYAESINTAPGFSLPKSDSPDKNKAHSRANKYVVDNSKPRTDLEYDPLSNYSANLRSFNASVEEPKGKNGHDLKGSKIPEPCEQMKPVVNQCQIPQSPALLDDLIEDGDLVIDIPSSPDHKRQRIQKHVSSAGDKSLQVKVDDSKDVKTEPILLFSPKLCPANIAACGTSPPAPSVEENPVKPNYSAQNGQGQSDLYGNRECANVPIKIECDVDLTGCLENFEVKQRSPPAAAIQQYPNCSNSMVNGKGIAFQVDLQCDLPRSAEEINPLPPHNFPQNGSLFNGAPAANPNSPSTVVLQNQKSSNKGPGQMQVKAAANSADCYVELTEVTSGSSEGQTWQNQPASITADTPEPPPPPPPPPPSSSSLPSISPEQPVEGKDVIIIGSSSDEEDEHHYSDMELSDSDPMEECYRIFMESNSEKANDEQTSMSVEATDAENPELNVKPQTLSGRKRVAHEAKHAEQPFAKSRPQPQVLVPLRGPAMSGFVTQPSGTPKIQQVQQRASTLTSSLKGGQAFVCSIGHRKGQSTSTPAPQNVQPVPVQSAYMNYIPLRNTVIDVGNNLHLILPEGTFPLPVTSSSSPVTTVLTPISHVPVSAVPFKQINHPQAVNPLQRYRATAPVLIPALARKSSLPSAFAPANSAASNPPQATVKPTKRKSKQQHEAKDKVPHDIRQRYINMFTEEFLKTTANVNEAFEKALAEEKTVYNRSVNKLKYLSVAVNALKKLKNQSAVAAKDDNKADSQRLKGNIPLDLKKLKENDEIALYETLRDYILTEEMLIESNYPVQHPEKPGCAVFFAENKKVNTDPLKRICCRCGATYSVSQTGKHVRKEECNYHYGKGVRNRVPGGVETRYSCCEGVMGAPGCQVFKLHVHDSLSLDGFVTTVPRCQTDASCPGVYSLDCAMCYTILGLELCRVTVVNSSLQVIYDTFVKPDSEVIDYNTRFSGISEEDVKGNCTSLREVQETLLSFINADTILIGYSLEADLCALKLLHGTVVDTSVVFPHRLGPPNKRTLNSLTAEYLRRIIQESVCGHDTEEDAAACMELMLWKVKEDGKLKK